MTRWIPVKSHGTNVMKFAAGDVNGHGSAEAYNSGLIISVLISAASGGYASKRSRDDKSELSTTHGSYPSFSSKQRAHPYWKAKFTDK